VAVVLMMEMITAEVKQVAQAVVVHTTHQELPQVEWVVVVQEQPIKVIVAEMYLELEILATPSFMFQVAVVVQVLLAVIATHHQHKVVTAVLV